MKMFVCIDDTDNYDSIGTGELLENMMGEAAIKGLAKAEFTVRYQLYIHDDIPYTSHNSSMCCAAETGDREVFTEFCEKYLEENSADGSDPGICILRSSIGSLRILHHSGRNFCSFCSLSSGNIEMLHGYPRGGIFMDSGCDALRRNCI